MTGDALGSWRALPASPGGSPPCRMLTEGPEPGGPPAIFPGSRPRSLLAADEHATGAATAAG
jgi:hypothetical protein